MFFQFSFKTLKERKGISCAASKTGDYLTMKQASHFTCIALHDDIIHANLAVTSEGNLPLTPYRENSRALKMYQRPILLNRNYCLVFKFYTNILALDYALVRRSKVTK